MGTSSYAGVGTNKMKKTIWTFLFLFCSLTSFSQGNNIVYEQIALDFFADSIVGNKEPFLACKVHFDGEVDSSITTIRYHLTAKYPNDKELKEQYEIAQTANNEFWGNNKRETFELNTHPPIEKRKYKKNYGRKSDVVRLMVFQNKQVGQRNYVWFRTFTGDGYQGQDLHFIMDINGNVLDWTQTSFIF